MNTKKVTQDGVSFLVLVNSKAVAAMDVLYKFKEADEKKRLDGATILEEKEGQGEDGCDEQPTNARKKRKTTA